MTKMTIQIISMQKLLMHLITQMSKIGCVHFHRIILLDRNEYLYIMNSTSAILDHTFSCTYIPTLIHC